MKSEGGCYCGALRFEVTLAAALNAQCHCRQCQYFSGGGPNYFMLVPDEGFSWTRGTPESYAHKEHKAPVRREFCGSCGTHIATRRSGLSQVIIKPGTMDNPRLFQASAMAVFTEDRQPWHVIPDGIPSFEKLPVQS